MFGKKRIADLEALVAALRRKCDDLDGRTEVLAAESTELMDARYGLQRKHDGLADQVAAQAELFDGMVKSHAKEIKRVSDLQEKLSQLGRKKVRRRSPATGRFESVFEDELTDE